jgi:hypothetical protein
MLSSGALNVVVHSCNERDSATRAQDCMSAAIATELATVPVVEHDQGSNQGSNRAEARWECWLVWQICTICNLGCPEHEASSGACNDVFRVILLRTCPRRLLASRDELRDDPWTLGIAHMTSKRQAHHKPMHQAHSRRANVLP